MKAKFFSTGFLQISGESCELKNNNAFAKTLILLFFLLSFNQRAFLQTLNTEAGPLKGEASLTNYVGDVAIVKIGPASAKPGDIITYKLEITNTGPRDVDGAVITNEHSDKFTVRTIAASAISWTNSLTIVPDDNDLTAQKLEGAGIVIPHLPAGGAVNLLITGIAETGVINSTASVLLPATASDPNPDNNADTYVTTVFFSEKLTTYEFDIDETLKQAGDMKADGGSFNLIYKLSSGTAIRSLGETIKIPFSYSRLNNTATGAVNNWDKLSNTSLGLNLGIDPLSLFTNMPSCNVNEFAEIKPVTNTDIIFSKYLTDGTLALLGTAYMSIGNIPTPSESNVKLVDEKVVLWQVGNLLQEASSNLNKAGFWIHQLGNTSLNTNIALARSVPDTVRHNAVYPLVYSAFSINPSALYLTGTDRGPKIASGKIVFSTSSTLPLNLLSFEAKNINNAVQLRWFTASEINTRNFEIERSADGAKFEKIGQVDAVNISGTHSYSFTDKAPLNGRNIYRLKMTDIDGSFTYSQSKAVEIFTANSISIFPNPVINTLHVRNAATGTAVCITDVSGRILQQQKITTTDYQIEMSKYPVGIYVIQMTDNNGKAHTTKIIKQ